jgi:hypothetical protein
VDRDSVGVSLNLFHERHGRGSFRRYVIIPAELILEPLKVHSVVRSCLNLQLARILDVSRTGADSRSNEPLLGTDRLFTSSISRTVGDAQNSCRRVQAIRKTGAKRQSNIARDWLRPIMSRSVPRLVETPIPCRFCVLSHRERAGRRLVFRPANPRQLQGRRNPSAGICRSGEK